MRERQDKADGATLEDFSWVKLFIANDKVNDIYLQKDALGT